MPIGNCLLRSPHRAAAAELLRIGVGHGLGLRLAQPDLAHVVIAACDLSDPWGRTLARLAAELALPTAVDPQTSLPHVVLAAPWRALAELVEPRCSCTGLRPIRDWAAGPEPWTSVSPILAATAGGCWVAWVGRHRASGRMPLRRAAAPAA